MTLQELNDLDKQVRLEKLLTCCGSQTWANGLNELFPCLSISELVEKSDACWEKVGREDILEAFNHHPKIGDISSLEKKFATTKDWAGNEQSGVNAASQDVLYQLKKGNDDYEEKFGYIFIVCATGKSASEMLEILMSRIPNSLEKELPIAAAEQNKITHIRLHKLLA
jgi:2-oxo-4-hydroxy-4-carboxy-5-ureidoimidazoline decarboxylase